MLQVSRRHQGILHAEVPRGQVSPFSFFYNSLPPKQGKSAQAKGKRGEKK